MTFLQANNDATPSVVNHFVQYLGWPDNDNAESWIAVPSGNLVHVLVLQTYGLHGRNDNCRAGRAAYGESTLKSFLHKLKNLPGRHALERVTLLMLREGDSGAAEQLLGKLMPLAVRKDFGLTSSWDSTSVEVIISSMKSRVAGGAK